MSDFEDLFSGNSTPDTSPISYLFTVFGDDVTYRDVSAGTTSTVTAIKREQVGATGDVNQDAFYRLLQSEVTAPENGDTLTDSDNVEWTIVKIREKKIGVWEVRCFAPEEVI